MKALISLGFLLSFTAFGSVTETNKEISIHYSLPEAKAFYSALQLPIDFGTLVTGKNHSYKAFQDKNKNFLIYCSERPVYECVISIKKEISGDNVYVEETESDVHLMINDYDQARALYEALNVKLMSHGNYIIKVLTDENNSASVGCLVDRTTYADYQCDLRIFK